MVCCCIVAAVHSHVVASRFICLCVCLFPSPPYLYFADPPPFFPSPLSHLPLWSLSFCLSLSLPCLHVSLSPCFAVFFFVCFHFPFDWFCFSPPSVMFLSCLVTLSEHCFIIPPPIYLFIYLSAYQYPSVPLSFPHLSCSS